MSVPAPMKVTGLTVKNTLHADEAWLNKLCVKDKITRKNVDIFDFVTKRLETVNLLEKKMQGMIGEIEKAVQEIHTMKENLGAVSSGTAEPVEGPEGPIGPQGPQGPPGPAGKVGPRGLRGMRGEGATKISLMTDVDVSELKDGCALIWSSDAKQWQAQSIFDE